MELNRIAKKSPSTPISKIACHYATPKRSPLLGRSVATPLGSVDEEKKEDRPAIRNPFDVKAESLYFHSCSPSVFATFATKKANDGTLRWSIDHLSVLYPADIDESSLPEPWVDSEQDLKAQKAIDTFFSQNSIVPSPWSSSPNKNNNLKSRRMTRIGSMFEDFNGESCDAATQTALSIPPDVDLKKILGNFFTCDDDDGVGSSNSSRENSSREENDSLSTSSLRRKLFASEDFCISPCKMESKELSPRRWSTRSFHPRSNRGTPASDVLSSSPITSPIRSESCNILNSPPVSPIANCPSTSGVQFKPFCENATGSIFESPTSVSRLQSSPIFVSSETTSAMSFSADSQDTMPFPSSLRQDTGYVTGSISAASCENMTSSGGPSCFRVSRITPVAELMDECDLSNSVSCSDVNTSSLNDAKTVGDMSYLNDVRPAGDMSYLNDADGGFEEVSHFDNLSGAKSKRSCNFISYPWVPNCASTPSQANANVL